MSSRGINFTGKIFMSTQQKILILNRYLVFLQNQRGMEVVTLIDKMNLLRNI